MYFQKRKTEFQNSKSEFQNSKNELHNSICPSPKDEDFHSKGQIAISFLDMTFSDTLEKQQYCNGQPGWNKNYEMLGEACIGNYG